MITFAPRYAAVALLVVMAAIRLASLAGYPLMDTTEARYAEIARKMVELNDWVTPWFAYDIPFWGKPPLSFWATAASFKVLGVSEFSARLPHFLCGLLILWLIWRWALQKSSTTSLYSTAILGSMLLFYVSAGFVMTDIWLLLGTVISMIAFWQFIHAGCKTSNGMWFFAGIGVGLLAKGPIALILIFTPVVLWLALNRKYLSRAKRLPWVRGLALMLVLAGPWYVMAELKTPGFINYFIVGEHFSRFITPGWEGDLYGSAHDQPKGMIWLYFFIDSLPWLPLLALLALFLKVKGHFSWPASTEDGWHAYLLIWAVTPGLFFTFAGNILWPYVLPGLPPLAIWLAEWLRAQSRLRPLHQELFLLTGILSALVISVGSFVSLQTSDIAERRSAKSLVHHYRAVASQEEPLAYYRKMPFSATFYMGGKGELLAGQEELREMLGNAPFFLAITPRDADRLPPELKSRLAAGVEIGRYTLYRVLKNQDQAS